MINFYFTNAIDGIKPKSPVADIYAQIDADLAKALDYLPQTWEVGTSNPYPGRLTKGAVNTLWAQTYLFRANWAKVVSLCNEVVASNQYSLLPNFYDIWKDGLDGAGKNSAESILEHQNLQGKNLVPNQGSNWGTSQNVRQGGAAKEWNLGWGWNTPTQKLVDAWDDSDPRKRMTILYSGQSDGGPTQGGYGATLPAYNPGPGLDQPYWNKKVYSDPQMRALTGTIGGGNASWISHRQLRYADVILMLAEASNEMGDGATAATNLELIRNRASGNLGPARTIVPKIAFANQAQMRTAIKMKEDSSLPWKDTASLTW